MYFYNKENISYQNKDDISYENYVYSKKRESLLNNTYKIVDDEKNTDRRKSSSIHINAMNSKAYVNAMKALQDKIRSLEGTILLKEEIISSIKTDLDRRNKEIKEIKDENYEFKRNGRTDYNNMKDSYELLIRNFELIQSSSEEKTKENIKLKKEIDNLKNNYDREITNFQHELDKIHELYKMKNIALEKENTNLRTENLELNKKINNILIQEKSEKNSIESNLSEIESENDDNFKNSKFIKPLMNSESFNIKDLSLNDIKTPDFFQNKSFNLFQDQKNENNSDFKEEMNKLEKEIDLMNQEYQELLSKSQNNNYSLEKNDIRKKLTELGESLKKANNRLYKQKKENQFNRFQSFQKLVK